MNFIFMTEVIGFKEGVINVRKLDIKNIIVEQYIYIYYEYVF